MKIAIFHEFYENQDRLKIGHWDYIVCIWATSDFVTIPISLTTWAVLWKMHDLDVRMTKAQLREKKSCV